MSEVDSPVKTADKAGNRNMYETTLSADWHNEVVSLASFMSSSVTGVDNQLYLRAPIHTAEERWEAVIKGSTSAPRTCLRRDCIKGTEFSSRQRSAGRSAHPLVRTLEM